MISVVLPVYNEPIKFIEQSLRSIINQTYQNLEIIVVDDNPARKDLVNFLRKEQASDKRIKIIFNEKNLGLTASLNKAMNLASGDYVARMDADDISMPTRFEKQLEFLNKNHLSLVGSSIVVFDINEQGQEIIKKTLHRPVNDKTIKKFLHYNNALFHPTWFGKIELFKKYRYIDFPACEDYEFLTRIALDGERLGNIKAPLLKYRSNPEGISKNKKILQKTSLLYISQNYRKNKKSNLNRFKEYLASPNGYKTQRRMEAYYTEAKKLEERKHKKEYLSYTLLVIKTLLKNPIAYRLNNNSIRSKYLIAAAKKDKQQ